MTLSLADFYIGLSSKIFKAEINEFKLTLCWPENVKCYGLGHEQVNKLDKLLKHDWERSWFFALRSQLHRRSLATILGNTLPIPERTQSRQNLAWQKHDVWIAVVTESCGKAELVELNCLPNLKLDRGMHSVDQGLNKKVVPFKRREDNPLPNPYPPSPTLS